LRYTPHTLTPLWRFPLAPVRWGSFLEQSHGKEIRTETEIAKIKARHGQG
jgi:hypothetical protein